MREKEESGVPERNVDGFVDVEDNPRKFASSPVLPKPAAEAL